MKDKISPLRIAFCFWYTQFDSNTIIFAPRNEKVVVDFLNYFLEEPYYNSISECYDNSYILNCVLLTRDKRNKWHLKVGFHGKPFVEFDMPKTQELINAFLTEYRGAFGNFDEEV